MLKSSDPMNPKVREEEDRRLARAIQENSSEVKNYIDPSLLEWYGEEVKHEVNTVTVSKSYVNVLTVLGRMLNPDEKQAIYLKIGFSKDGSIMALRATESNAIKAIKEKKANSIRINKTKGVKQLLQEKGWPDICKAKAHWDKQSQMVVVRRPDDGSKRK